VYALRSGLYQIHLGLTLFVAVFIGLSLLVAFWAMGLVRQADADPAFHDFAENARWRKGGVTFATLNLAGTHNNQELRVEKYWREFVRREQANLAWVKATFAEARRAKQRAAFRRETRHAPRAAPFGP